MAKKPAAAAPPEQTALYQKLFATYPEAELKGATVPYTSVNGNMSSYLHPSGLVALRMPAGPREEFLEKYQTKLFEAYGIVQKEYVTIPARLLEDIDELAPHFAQSFEYTKSLKPKKTSR
jgi:hypothetical protein